MCLKCAPAAPPPLLPELPLRPPGVITQPPPTPPAPPFVLALQPPGVLGYGETLYSVTIQKGNNLLLT